MKYCIDTRYALPVHKTKSGRLDMGTQTGSRSRNSMTYSRVHTNPFIINTTHDSGCYAELERWSTSHVDTMAEEPPPNLVALPRDVLTHVASFLDSRNALNLSLINSVFRRTLFLSIIHAPEPLIRRCTWDGGYSGEEGHTPRRFGLIPTLLPYQTHSVILSCQWNDQGWGYQKGALFVVALPKNDDLNLNTLSSIENGQIIYETPVAPHEKSPLQISFNYCPSKSYFLWYRVGGGGGHRLEVENLNVHTLIFDRDNV